MSVNMMAASLRCSVASVIAQLPCECSAFPARNLSSRNRCVRSKDARGNNLLGQFFKPRIAMKRFEQRIDSNGPDVKAVPLSKTILETPQGLITIAQPEVYNCQSISGGVPLLSFLLQLFQNFPRFVFSAEQAVKMSKVRE